MRLTRRFVLISSWCLHAPREEVWALLRDPESWPRWWPGLCEVRSLGGGDGEGLGAVSRFVWQSGAGYKLNITTTTVRLSPLREIEAVADGDVAGRGLWLLEEATPGTVRLAYRWDVELRRAWMRLLAPLLRPLFTRRHFALMRAGAAGMARSLGAAAGEYREWASPVSLDEPAAQAVVRADK